MSNIITDIPQCKKQNCKELCKPSKWTKSGYTAYCSRAHANSKIHSDETKTKIKTSSLNRYKNTTSKIKGKKFYKKNSMSRLFSVLLIPDDVLINKDIKARYLSKSFYVKIMSNYSCEQCGISHWNGARVYLETDHIDGDRKNNRLENLRVLCRNCHTQTHTYSLGKGKRRKYECKAYKCLSNEDMESDFNHLSQNNKRAMVFKEQDKKCLFCGIEDWKGKQIAFEMDHIDGDNKNNRRDNLRVLCPNCHAQTDTFRI